MVLKEVQDRTNAEIDRLIAEKDAWEDRLMRTFLPMELYQAGHEGKRLTRIKRWLENEGFEIREVPSENLTQFCRKGRVLAEFKIEFKK